MPFTLFDLPAVIREHNALYPKACLSESETFGLNAFSPERQKLMEQGLYLYVNVYYEKKGFNPASINSSRTILMGLKDLELRDSIRAARKFVDEHSEDRYLTEAFLERKEKAEALKVDELFAHYHCSALLQAFEYLRIIESAFKDAKAEIEKARRRRFKKIPDKIILEMQAYFNVQLGIVRDQYERLTQAMLERLKHAHEEGSLTQADVLSALVKRHRDEGRVEPSYVVPAMPSDQLTPEIFHRFHQVISLYGNKKARAKLSQFPWLDSEKSDLSIREQVASRFGVLTDIPKKPRNPRFLFLGHNLRYEWFDSFYSFAQIDTHLKKTELFLEAANEHILEECVASIELQAMRVESLMAEEKARCEIQLTQLNTWWRRPFNQSTLEFIDKIHKEICKKEREFLQQNGQLKKLQEESLFYRHRLDRENKLLESIRLESLSDLDVQNLIAYCKNLSPNNHLDKKFLDKLSVVLDEIIEKLGRGCLFENTPQDTVQRYIQLVDTLGNTQQRQALSENYDVLQRELDQEVRELDKKLIESLFSMPEFDFTESNQKYWLMRRNQMMKEKCLSVAEVANYNLADEIFFGTKEKGPRQLIGLLLNFTTSMLYNVKKLSACHDPDMKMQKIKSIKLKWLEGLKKLNNKSLENIFMQHWEQNHHQTKLGASL